MANAADSVRIFSTCPQSKDLPREKYVEAVAEVARWSESVGCSGILVYADNGLVDPWLVAQVIVQSTQGLSPLVAVQPVYMHPYAAAKLVASFGHMYGRRIYLNMVAGGFKNDLAALNDPTSHDERYARLIEYTLVMKALLSSDKPVSFSGRYYRVGNLRMTPPAAPELAPEFLISGSSEAGLAAARATGATPVRYPEPPGHEESDVTDRLTHSGVRVGIIARETAADAWSVAHERFPEDRRGQLTHQLAMKVSD
jgi:alkanesulfonate monooxygenase